MTLIEIKSNLMYIVWWFLLFYAFIYEGQFSESFVQVYSLTADKLKNQQPGEKVDVQEGIF
jgi:hypothetical protein